MLTEKNMLPNQTIAAIRCIQRMTSSTIGRMNMCIVKRGRQFVEIDECNFPIEMLYLYASNGCIGACERKISSVFIVIYFYIPKLPRTASMISVVISVCPFSRANSSMLVLAIGRTKLGTRSKRAKASGVHTGPVGSGS